MNTMPVQKRNPVAFQKATKPLRTLKTKTESQSGNEIWLLTLSDLLMLLMIFFVFLLAVPLAGAGKSVTSVSEARPAAQSVVANASSPAVPVTESTTARDKQAAALESDLKSTMGSLEIPQGVMVERRTQFIVMTFPEQILFDSGRAQLRATSGPTLEKVAVFLSRHPELTVEVQGHTDDRRISTDRYPSNWELSADRAGRVARTLVELGANPQQIAIKGFGEHQPVVPNTSETDRLKNRRVEIRFSIPEP